MPGNQSCSLLFLSALLTFTTAIHAFKHNNLAKIIMEGKYEGREDKYINGRQYKDMARIQDNVDWKLRTIIAGDLLSYYRHGTGGCWQWCVSYWGISLAGV